MTAPSITSIATTASSGNISTVGVGVPSGTQAGDLLVAVVSWVGPVGITAVEGGWTPETGIQSGDDKISMRVFHREATGSEPANYSFARDDGSGRVCAAIVRVSDDDGIEGYDASPGDSATATAPSLLSLGSDRLALRVFTKWFDEDFTYPDVPEFDIASTGGGDNSRNRLGLVAEQVGSGETGTSSATMGTARDWVAATILVSPTEVSDPANLQVTVDGTTAQLTWDASPLLAP